MLHYETVSSDLLSILKKMQSLPELAAFRLVGGTSLALQIGHRISKDIDLFTDKSFVIPELQKTLSKTFNSFEVLWSNKNGFVSNIDNIKVDFFDWHIPFLKDAIKEDGICLADNTEPPKMVIPYDWESAKSLIVKTVNGYINDMKSGIVRQQEDRLKKAEQLLKSKKKKS